MGQAVCLASNFGALDDSFKAGTVTLGEGKASIKVPARGVLS